MAENQEKYEGRIKSEDGKLRKINTRENEKEGRVKGGKWELKDWLELAGEQEEKEEESKE